jgi:glycosyltransferase involved in cell wall biosynthesis
MRILFYIPDLDQTSGGVRQYAVGLLKILATLPEHHTFILHNNDDPLILDLIEDHDQLQLIPKKIGLEKKWERKKYRASRGIQFLREKASNKDFKVRSYLDRICRKYKIEIVHSPYQEQPFPSKTKNIFTLHDVQELHFPEYFSPADREFRARTWLYNIKRTDKIIVSYQHVKDDIIKYFGVDEEIIEVVLLNMQNLWFSEYSDSDVVNIKSKHGFESFLLYAANTWQHKNHSGLLEALAYLRDERNIKVNVVLTGHQNQNFIEIEKQVETLALSDQVKFLGIVDEITLFSLYQQCKGVVIPTAYEAGSFPLMESILMGIPVVCSNVTSLPETIGNEAYTFDPFNKIEMSDLIEKLWTNENFRIENTSHTNKMRERLSNTGAIEKLLRIYESI